MQTSLSPWLLGLAVLVGGIPRSAAAAPPPVEGEPVMTLVATTDPEAALVRRHGETAINWLGRKLVLEMNSGLQREGATASVPIAHLRTISRDGQVLPGMPSITGIKLTSLRLLNAANAPDAAEQQVLDHIARDIRLGNMRDETIVQRITAPDGTTEWRAYRPLAVLPTCLACHGDTAAQPASLQTLLREHAPAEAAVGYEPGEWRGVLRVTVQAPGG